MVDVLTGLQEEMEAVSQHPVPWISECDLVSVHVRFLYCQKDNILGELRRSGEIREVGIADVMCEQYLQSGE